MKNKKTTIDFEKIIENLEATNERFKRTNLVLKMIADTLSNQPIGPKKIIN